MPILKNAKKALRSSTKKAEVNGRIRSMLKTMADKMIKTPSAEVLSQAFSAVDKAVKRKVIHANKAARIKSRMSKLIVTK